MRFENFIIVSFQIVLNNNQVLYIPGQLVICIASVLVYLLHMDFTFVAVRLWSGF